MASGRDSLDRSLSPTHPSPRPTYGGIYSLCIRFYNVNNFYANFRTHKRLIGRAIKSHRFGKLLTTYLRYNFMPFVGSRQSIIIRHCHTTNRPPPPSSPARALMNYGVYLMLFDCVVLMTSIFDTIRGDICLASCSRDFNFIFGKLYFRWPYR